MLGVLTPGRTLESPGVPWKKACWWRDNWKLKYKIKSKFIIPSRNNKYLEMVIMEYGTVATQKTIQCSWDKLRNLIEGYLKITEVYVIKISFLPRLILAVPSRSNFCRFLFCFVIMDKLLSNTYVAMKKGPKWSIQSWRTNLGQKLRLWYWC